MNPTVYILNPKKCQCILGLVINNTKDVKVTQAQYVGYNLLILLIIN